MRKVPDDLFGDMLECCKESLNKSIADGNERVIKINKRILEQAEDVSILVGSDI